MRYTLIPVGEGKEFLQTIYLDSGNLALQKVTLGRNATTGLVDGGQNTIHVSRQHIQIYFEGEILFMLAVARQDRIVELNRVACGRSPIQLRVGDVISLIGALQYYNYVVSTVNVKNVFNIQKAMELNNKREPILIDDVPAAKKQRITSFEQEVINLDDSFDKSEKSSIFSEPFVPVSSSTYAYTSIVCSSNDFNKNNLSAEPTLENAVPTANSDPTTLIESIGCTESSSKPTHHLNEVIKNVLRQYECAICYETMACAVSLTPCGDTFCFGCILEWSAHNSTCPSCNGQFDLAGAIPNRVTDNAVREVLKDETEDLEAWEKRCAEGTEARKKFLAEKTTGKKTTSSIVSNPPISTPQVMTTSANPIVDTQRRGFVDLTDSIPTDPMSNSHFGIRNPDPARSTMFRWRIGSEPNRNSVHSNYGRK